MKKLAALLLALIMGAAFIPAYAAQPESVDVTYTGATVNAANLAVGGKFQFTVSVSAASSMWSGHWLIDYPEEYLTPTNCSTTWSGSVYYLINQSYENGNPTSDKPMFVTNMSYEGMTGSVPYGEAGNWYTVVGMYLTTFNYWGMQMGGPFVRVTYRIDQFPTVGAAQQDANGYYLEIPIIVLESRYWVQGAAISPDVEYYRDHENVTVVNGKVYIQAVQGEDHTVTFYGFDGSVLSTQQVADGAAATAPSVPSVINNSNGTYRFYGWDVDFSHVGSDLEVHAVYVLVGDVDLNGTVNSADALLAMRYAMNIASLNGMQICAGEVTNDASLNSADALKILRYTMSLIPSLV